MNVRNLLSYTLQLASAKGVRFTIDSGLKRLFHLVYYIHFRSHKKTFVFRGRKYSYFHHYYNTTWYSERAVELPIIVETVERHSGKEILEVGNVLSHYRNIAHDVIDKFESGVHVTNENTAEFKTTKLYNLNKSISTLEHIGWDEAPYDDTKILRVLDNLISLLSENGEMIVTLPLGYDLTLDKLLKMKVIQFDDQYCLKRVSKSNEWVEVSCEELDNISYGEPFPGANGLLVAISQRRKTWKNSSQKR
jgi:hypothetical protein